jgi:catechol 2,3-dioxygenase-like lactoylglutathione lyase family enzyme
MEQRVSLITLGVADLERSRQFYERLGCEDQWPRLKTKYFVKLEGWP